MTRRVQVSRCKRTGAFLVNPVGSFRGYGAYVGINPYREAPGDAPDETLGQVVVDLLTFSGPTGLPINSAKQFLEETEDEETARLRRKYGFTLPGLTASKLARQFLFASVDQKRGQ